MPVIVPHSVSGHLDSLSKGGARWNVIGSRMKPRLCLVHIIVSMRMRSFSTRPVRTAATIFERLPGAVAYDPEFFFVLELPIVHLEANGCPPVEFSLVFGDKPQVEFDRRERLGLHACDGERVLAVELRATAQRRRQLLRAIAPPESLGFEAA